MPTKREIFSRNLRRLVEKSHLNQVQLAELCSVSAGSFNDWCHARTYPRPEKMEHLAKALGVTVYDLITDFETPDARQKMAKSVEEIANELRENPDARELYTAIARLSADDMLTVRRLVFSLLKD